MRKEVFSLSKGRYQSMVNKKHMILYFVIRSRAVCEMVSNWHEDEQESTLRRYNVEKKEYVDMNTSTVIVDHKKGGFLNCDAADAATYTASPMKRRTCHSWRTDLEIPIFRMATVNAWILFRALHPDDKITHINFLIKLSSKRIKGNFLCRQRKRAREDDGPYSLQGKNRFTGLPVSKLSPAQIRAELGPRRWRDYNPEVTEHAVTMLHRAKSCMYYYGVLWQRKNQCCFCKRRAVTHQRCVGCGAIACINTQEEMGMSHFQKIHKRYNKAMVALRRAARSTKPTWAN